MSDRVAASRRWGIARRREDSDETTRAMIVLQYASGQTNDDTLLILSRIEAQGWKLVPIEPTTVQVNAGVDADDLRTGFETVKHIYRTMIGISP